MIRCPKCGSDHYYYEGTFIICRDCEYEVKLPDSKIPEDWRVDDG